MCNGKKNPGSIFQCEGLAAIPSIHHRKRRMGTRLSVGMANTRRILVVDDHDPTRHVLLAFLRRRGLEAVEVANGNAALALLARENFDLILLDLWLGDTTGLELLREIRNQGRTTEVIMMSGDAQLTDVFTARRLGIVEFLHKPFEFERLEAILDELLPNSGATRGRSQTLPLASGSAF
jgi:DNA-binding response OmpR family regulator